MSYHFSLNKAFFNRKKAGTFSLYEDDAKTFDYQKGLYRTRQILISAEGKLSIKTKGKSPALFGKILSVEKPRN